MTTTRQPPSTVRFSAADRANIRVIREHYALRTESDALRVALKLVADRVRAETKIKT